MISCPNQQKRTSCAVVDHHRPCSPMHDAVSIGRRQLTGCLNGKRTHLSNRHRHAPTPACAQKHPLASHYKHAAICQIRVYGFAKAMRLNTLNKGGMHRCGTGRLMRRVAFCCHNLRGMRNSAMCQQTKRKCNDETVAPVQIRTLWLFWCARFHKRPGNTWHHGGVF